MLALGKPNQSLQMMMLFSSNPGLAARRYGMPTKRLDDFTRALRATMIAQFQANQSNFVISGEKLSSTLVADEIETLKTFLSAWFEDIRIIVYIRDPRSYMSSAFQQSAKTTAVLFGLEPFVPEYHRRIGDWIKVFGREKIDAVLYDRKTFDQGSIIHDFARRIGADVARVSSMQRNESLRAEGLALTYAIRNTIASRKLPLLQWVRLRADLYLTPRFGQRQFDFDDHIYERALADQNDDIAWAEQLLRQEFLVPKRAANTVIFGSHDDILQYATKCRPEFAAWKRTHFGTVRRLAYLARALRRRLTLGLHSSQK